MKGRRLFALLLILAVLLGLAPAAPKAQAAGARLGFDRYPTDIITGDSSWTSLRWTFDFDPEDYPGLKVYLREAGGSDLNEFDITNKRWFSDESGHDPVLKREMAIRIPGCFGGEAFLWELEIRDDPGGAWQGSVSTAFRIDRLPGGNAHFTDPPKTVYVPEGESGVISWSVDSDLRDGDDSCFLISRGISPIQTRVVDVCTDVNGDPLRCGREMTVKLPWYFAGPMYYQVAVWTVDYGLVYSEPFWVVRVPDRPLGFERQPANTTAFGNDPAELSWVFDFYPEQYPELEVYLHETETDKWYDVTDPETGITNWDGGPVKLLRRTGVLIPQELAKSASPWELVIADAGDGVWQGSASDSFLISWSPGENFGFVRSPGSVAFTEGQDVAELSWSVDFTPPDNETFFIMGGNAGTKKVYAYLRDPDGEPAENRRDMRVLVTRDMACTSPYRIAWTLDGGEMYYSEPFYILDGSAFRFLQQPETTTVDQAGAQSISWTVPFEPPDNDTFWITGGDWKDKLVRIYDKYWNEDGEPAENRAETSILVSGTDVNPEPYYIVMKDPLGELHYSDPFYIKNADNMPCFVEPPKDVLVVDGVGTLHWSVDYEPTGEAFRLFYFPQTAGYTDTVSARNITFKKAYALFSGIPDQEVPVSREMTLTVDDGWVSTSPYSIWLIKDGYQGPYSVTSNHFWIFKGYNVTFAGGKYTEEIPVQTVREGKCAVPPAIPSAIPGYALEGWYTDSALTRPYDFSAPVTGHLTLYAKWTPRTCLVTFHVKGGAPEPVPQQVTYGGYASRIAGSIEKEGCTFGGWYMDPLYIRAFDFNAPVTRDLDLYAKWDPVVFQVSFLTEVGETPARQRVEWGKTVPYPGPMSLEGYIFGGWWLDGKEYDFSTPVTNSFHLTAKWTKICTVSFDPAGGAGSMAPETVLQRKSFTAPECAFAPPEGKRFLRWDISTGGSVSPGRSFTVMGDTVLTPRWANIVYHTVTFNMNGHGEQMEPLRVERDTAPVKPEDPAAEGYTFLGWYISGTGADLGAMYAIYPFDFTQPLTADRTVYARWQDNSVFKITLELAGEGVGTAELWINDVEDPEGPKSVYYAHPGDTVWVRELAPGIESVLRSVEYQYYDYTYHQSRTKDITGTQRFTMPSSEVRVTVIFDRTPDAHPHSAETLTHVEAREGNCMTDGWLEHWECPVCGKWFRYNDWYGSYDAVAKTDPWFIEAPGHRLGEPVRRTVAEPTCETEGVCIDYYYCQNENCSLGRDEYVEYRTYVLPAAGHDWGPVTYAYVEYPYTVEARRVCLNDPAHVESEVAEYEVWNYWPADCIWCETYLLVWEFENPAFALWGDWYDVSEPLGHDWDEGTVTSEPTCDHDGVRTYTCRRAGCGWTRTEAIPALGHDWGDFTFTWSGSMTRCTAHSVCRRENAAYEIYLDEPWLEYAVLAEPTCDSTGIGVYTAPFSTYWSYIPDQVKAVILPALGHDYEEPVYTWSADGSTVTARAVCRNDASHTVEETVRAAWTVTTMPTAAAPGAVTWTAAFSEPLFEAQTRTAEIPKLVAITASVSGSTVKYTLSAAPAGALLIAARYDGGRQTDIRAVPVSGLTGTVTLSGSGGTFRLFLVDAVTFLPLGPAWEN